METIIGIMGPGETSKEVLETAYKLGSAIAQKGWVVLTGGRRAGVMHEALRGAKESGGLTIGILPDDHAHDLSEFVDLSVMTGMGSARNMINILTSHVVIACGTGLGTTSEIVLALKAGKLVILIRQTEEAINFFTSFNIPNLHLVQTVNEVIELIEKHI